LFLDSKVGVSFFMTDGEETAAFFIAKADVGYQLITRGGLVFTQAVGCVYNGRNGFGINIMLDLGFAYR
jgi:hypothetical protein